MYVKIYVVFILLIHNVCSINILGIFDIPSKSVHILGHQLLSGLAKRGYNVTLISSFPLDEKPANYTHIFLDGLLEFKEQNYGTLIQGESKAGIFSMLNAQINFVNLAMENKNFQEFLKSGSKYDIIIQLYVLNEAYLALADHFDARIIGFVPFSSFPVIDTVTGNTSPYSYVPLPFAGFTDNMNFMQRTMNTIGVTVMSLLHKFYLFPQQEGISRKYFPNGRSLQNIQSDRLDLIFSNVHFSNESPRPNTPNIVHIGGYHVQKPQSLSDELKDYLDKAKQGAVFLGFGSNVETSKLPKEKLDIFLKTFAKSPYSVLFKYNGNMENKPKNIKTASWFPQTGVLAHPNTIMFISHGGRGAVIESLYYGVPTLCISFYGDQKKNCEEIEGYGYGIHLPYQEITHQTFEKAFNELTENPRYTQNAKYRAALFQEQEMDPFDRASFWIEHIYKFKGAKHLWPKSATMPLYQYLLIDVWAFIIFVLTLILFVLYKCVKFFLRLICKSNKNVDKVKKS